MVTVFSAAAAAAADDVTELFRNALGVLEPNDDVIDGIDVLDLEAIDVVLTLDANEADDLDDDELWGFLGTDIDLLCADDVAIAGNA